jgi:hypothetical protein
MLSNIGNPDTGSTQSLMFEKYSKLFKYTETLMP